MVEIGNILAAFGKLPRWFVAFAIVAAISVTIITVFGWDPYIITPILFASACIIAVREGYEKVMLEKNK